MESSVKWKFYQHTMKTFFDASQPAPLGWDLNSTLAKGKNNMKKLVETVIRWSIHKIGYHTDSKKIYNSVKLI